MKSIKEHLTDTICSVRNGSMDEKQFRATVEHNLNLMSQYERESFSSWIAEGCAENFTLVELAKFLRGKLTNKQYDITRKTK